MGDMTAVVILPQADEESSEVSQTWQKAESFVVSWLSGSENPHGAENLITLLQWGCWKVVTIQNYTVWVAFK